MSRSALPSPFTDFPLALWSAAFAMDVGSRWLGQAFAFAAFCNMVFGCVVAMLALVAGSLEYNRLANDAASRRHGLAHATLSAGALLCFTLSLYLRAIEPEVIATSSAAFLLAAAGLCLTLGAAWIGGHLAFSVETQQWAMVEPAPSRSRTA